MKTLFHPFRQPQAAALVHHPLRPLAAATMLLFAPALAAQFQSPTCYSAAGGASPGALAFGRSAAGGNPFMVTALVSNTRWFDHYPGGAQTSCPMFLAPAAAPLSSMNGDLGALDIVTGDVDPNTPGDEIVTLEVAGFGGTYQLQMYSGAAAIGLPVPVPVTSIQVLVRDLDLDGDADAVVLDSTGKLHVSLAAGGLLTPVVTVNLTAGLGPAVRMAIGSFDKDQRPDLVVVRGGGGVARAELRVGAAGGAFPFFGAGVMPPTTLFPTPLTACVTAGDFDGDGCDDFVIGGTSTGGGSPGLWICYVSRAGTLSPIVPHGFPSVDEPVAVTRGDFDLDGDLDLAVAATNNNVYIMPNSGLGSFALPTTPMIGSGVDIEACDLDGDGDLDLAICDGAAGGFTCVYCNDTETGRCHHVIRAGVADNYLDNFVNSVPTKEIAYPRAAIVPATTRWFDRAVPSLLAPLAHSFEGLPENIVAAKLYVRLKEQAAGDNLLGTDRLRLDFAGAGDWAFSTPVPTTDTVLCLDLADLSSSLNLLPRLEMVRYLDVMVDSFTAIDFMRLEVTTRCEAHEMTLRYDPVPGIDTYYHDAWTTPGTVTWDIDAGVPFATGLWIVGIDLDPSLGCLPFFSLCMTHVDFVFAGILDANGQGTGSIPIGANIAFRGIKLTTQAVALPPGPFTFAGSKWSHTISDIVY